MRVISICLLLTAPLGAGCSLMGNKKPNRQGPAPALPGPQMPVNSTRSQKPEPPPVVALPPTTLADGTIVVRAVAYVNNMPIFDSEVREALVMHLRELEGMSESEREKKLKELRTAELEKLIEREVVMISAKERLKNVPGKVLEDLQREAGKECDRRITEIKETYKLKSDDDLKRFFEQQGMSLTNFRRSVERSFIAMEFMRNVIIPKLQLPLSEMRAYYDQHPAEFDRQESVKWQDIFLDATKFSDRVSARRYADDVVSRLKQGVDFAAAAKQLSQAGYNLLPTDAGIGEHPGEITPAELAVAVFGLTPGQVGGPIEVPGGFHILKVTERTKAGRKPFDADTQRDIREKLLNLLAAKEYRRLIEIMKSDALIQRLE